MEVNLWRDFGVGEWISTGILIIIAVILSTAFWNRSKYPNGPFSFPIVGNLPQIILCGDMVSFVEKYRKIFGNVLTIEIGGQKRVVISGYENLHYVLVTRSDVTSNRSTAAFAGFHEEYFRKNGGLVFGDERIWKPARAFTRTFFRHEDLGKVMMELKIMTEVEDFDQHFIQPNIGIPIEISQIITYATSNIIRQILLGERYDYDDKELHRFNEALATVIHTMLKGGITKNIPLIKYFPFDFTGCKANEESGRYALSVTKDAISTVRQNLDSELYNYVYHSLRTYNAKKDQDESIALYLSDEMLTSTVYMLYHGGTDTTSALIRWAFLFMILYPDMQDKARHEIQEVLGERRVTMKDRDSLPYIDAIFHETLRHSNTAPEGLPHRTEVDLVVDGKTIPAGADLMLNFASVLWNPEYFLEPEKYNPERFIGDEGEKLKPKVVSFGIGGRNCLGEPLARMEFFFFIVTFLQMYRFTYPPDEKPTLKGNTDLTRQPEKYNIVFEKL